MAVDYLAKKVFTKIRKLKNLLDYDRFVPIWGLNDKSGDDKVRLIYVGKLEKRRNPQTF